MVWLGRNKAPDRIRPSEINGCQVQQVSYMDEIDDENVLEALEKLRGRSAASPVKAFLTPPTNKPPRVPKQSSVKSSSMGLSKQKSTKSIATANSASASQTVATQRTSSSNSHRSNVTPVMVQKVPSASPSKGSHRSYDSSSKKSSLQQAPPAAPISPDSSVASSVVSKPSSHRGAKQQQPAHPNKLIWAWLGKSLSEINCGGFSTKEGKEAAADQMKALGVIL
ncbi:MAG: hypothetical protein SGARI_006132, partial [Bacillariaceae sp.]